MRALGRWRDPVDHKLHPVIACSVDDQDQTVEVQECVEAGVAPACRHHGKVITRR
jgi:hypothetical protein